MAAFLCAESSPKSPALTMPLCLMGRGVTLMRARLNQAEMMVGTGLLQNGRWARYGRITIRPYGRKNRFHDSSFSNPQYLPSPQLRPLYQEIVKPISWYNTGPTSILQKSSW